MRRRGLSTASCAGVNGPNPSSSEYSTPLPYEGRGAMRPRQIGPGRNGHSPISATRPYTFERA